MKKLILIALIYSLSITLYAGNDGETRTATVKTQVSSSEVISIQAKNTELYIEAWDKNEVEIEATVRFDGKMTDRIEEFLNEFETLVNENVESGGGELKIDTDLDVPNRVQIGSKNIGINISYGDKELKIIYRIKAPGSNEYIINNSYEDVKLVGSFNKIDFTQYSGQLEAETIKSGKLKMKYGSADIKSLEESEMELYEQKLNINTLGTLDLNAKYSEFELGSVVKIEAISYESDFEIGSISELSGNFKYGKIDISGKIDEGEFVFYEMELEADDIGRLQMENSKYSKFDFDRANSIIFEQSYEDETEIGTLGSFKSQNSKYGNHSIRLLEGSLELNAYEDETEIEQLGENASEIDINGKYLDTWIGIGNSSFILTTNVKYGKAKYDEASVDVRRYIKNNDQLEVEVHSKTMTDNPIKISIRGYEADVTLN